MTYSVFDATQDAPALRLARLRFAAQPRGMSADASWGVR
jgi:hypothetical protein